MLNRVLIQRQMLRGEGKIVERQRKRERERGRVLVEMRDGVGNKFDH
jgi:hypothetical protein